MTADTDALSGEPGARSVTFGFDGYVYTIRLAQANTDRLARALDPFIAQARIIRRPAASRRRPDPHARLIRAWAREQGMTDAVRGRLGTGVIAAYRAAHPEGHS